MLRRDRARRALLIERCVPGHDLSAIADREAVRIALATGRELWRPVAGGPFRRAADELRRRLRDLATRSDHPLVGVAIDRLASLAPRDGVLVHGDYHQHNLLRHAGRWLAIDPKPLIAEPEFDVVTLLWNPLSLTLSREITERRVRQLVAAGLDGRRVRDWAIVRGVDLGLPLEPGAAEGAVRQLAVVRWLLE